MLGLEEYLLVKVSEEAGEITQAAAKASNFGMSDINPETGVTNAQAVVSEYSDLEGVLCMLSTYRRLFVGVGEDDPVVGTYSHENDNIKRRMVKVAYWAMRAIDNGVLYVTSQELKWLSDLSSQHTQT